MRLLFPVAIALASAAAALPAKSPPLQKPGQLAGSDCPSATDHFTRQGRVWTRDPVKPKKLAELPPADSYAAVYRLDERGCMVPVKFRDVRR
jgi:hypothetical protein